MSTLLHRTPKTILPDMIDWFEDPFLMLRPYLVQPIRVEEYAEDGRYLIKAELAGIDPEKDLDVTVGAGYVTVQAQRSGTLEGKQHSEFRYGSFSRTVSLPDSADLADVTASYRDGILTVSVGLKTAVAGETVRKIAIQADK